MKKVQGTIRWNGHPLSFFGISHKGQVRKVNEDDFLIMPELQLFCVADGMGGYEAGTVASRITLESVAQYMAYAMDSENATMPIGIAPELLSAPPMQACASYANTQVIKGAEGKMMGSTLVAVLFDAQGVQISHVGDSRTYLFRGGGMQQLTEDHSFVNELYHMGRITKEELRTHPRRNVITRAIGSNENVQPTVSSFPVGVGDVLLLCSDGLTSMIDDAVINQTIHSGQPLDKVGEQLIIQANEAGGRDNITVVLIQIL